MSTEYLSASEIDRLAHKRAAARMGWYIHATVYLLVNTGLYAGATIAGRHWLPGPLFAWGLALAIHGIVVWLAMPGARLYEHLLQKELARLQPQRDPW